MTIERMTLERFQTLLDAYGTSPARWPAAECDAAAGLLEQSAAARAMLAEAADLDHMLDAAPALAPTPAQRAAILAAAPRGGGRPVLTRLGDGWRRFFGELGDWRMGGAVLAASLVLGIVSGGWLAEGLSADSSPDLLQLALFDDSFAEY